METNEFILLLKRKKQTIFTIIIICLFISAILTISQPLKYGANSKLLIIQNYSQNFDPYNTAKANQYLSTLLSDVVGSNSFFISVLNSGFNINSDYFSGSPNQVMKKWRKTVQASPINDTGIISVYVFHKDKEQANQIARAVNSVMQASHKQYHGGGDNVAIKVIDQPVISTFPVKPNIFLNIALAFILGLIISLGYVYLFPEEKYDLKFFPGKKKKEKYHDNFHQEDNYIDVSANQNQFNKNVPNLPWQ